MKARDPGVVGIDVSKKALVVSTYGAGKSTKAQRVVEQDEDARSALVKALQRDRVTLVAVESTGGYERPLLKALHAAKIPTALLPPEQVKAFARSQRRRAKTDEIDCELIADYASVTEVALWEAPSPHLEEAAALARHRDTLVRERTREKNRLKMATSTSVRDSISEHIAFLNRRVRAIEKELVARIKGDGQSTARFELLQTVPGVGVLTAARLVAELPELGCIHARKLSSLAGLAPMNKDSGEIEGRRRCAPGRVQVRTALYQAAHTAVMINPVFREFYQRLMSKGKERKVALVAAARKLLVILNAMVRRGKSWDASRHSAPVKPLSADETAAIEANLADLEEPPESSTPESSAPESSTPATEPGNPTAMFIATRRPVAKRPTDRAAKNPTKAKAKPAAKRRGRGAPMAAQT